MINFDTQLYVHIKTQQCATEATRLTSCIAELDSWMTSNRLRLNSDKTQFIWVGSRQQLANVAVTEIIINGFSIKTSPVVTCLGVKIDAELTFSTHVKHISARCFYQLRQLWSIRPALTSDSAIILIHCNSTTVTVSYSRPLPYTSALYSR